MNVGMLFGIIFAIVVIGFVLFLGSDQIASFLGVSQEAAFLQQMNDFGDEVSNVYSLAMGSIKSYSFKVPSSIEKMCFVNPDDPSASPEGNWEPDDPLIRSVRNNGYNIVAFVKGKGFQGDTIENMIPEENFCISSATKILIENEGRYVSVRPS